MLSTHKILKKFLLLLFLLLSTNAYAQWNNWCYRDYYGNLGADVSMPTVNATFTVPAACDYVIIEAIGAGGGGGWANSTFAYQNKWSGGGGGGAYARCNQFAVTPGETISISIAPGGFATSGYVRRGGYSVATYKGVTKVSAAGGTTVTGSDGTEANVNTGAYGARASECIGDVCYSGGNGAAGKGGLDAYVMGGAGGGAASGGGNGSNATFLNGLETDGAGTGGNAGSTAANGLTNAAYANWLPGGRGANARDSEDGWGQNHCSNVGGGGSGARTQNLGHRSGGAGGPGMVRIWFHIANRNYTVTPSSPSTICYGSSTTLNCTTSNTTLGTVQYKWSNGATSASTTVAPTSTTTYRVTVTDNLQSYGVSSGNCAVTKTATTTVTVRAQFNAGAIASGHSLYVIGTASIPTTIGSSQNASGGDGNITYEWYVNGTALGNNSATLTINPSSFAEGTHTFTRRAKDGSCVGYTSSSGSFVLDVKSAGTSAPVEWDQWCYRDFTNSSHQDDAVSNITIPAGCDEIVLESIGAGGGGGNSSNDKSTGGAGGGAYARSYLTPLANVRTLTVTVGRHAYRDAENNYANRESHPSKVEYNGSVILQAACGGSVNDNSTSGVSGGQVANCVYNSVAYAGGTGGSRYKYNIVTYYAGGGGGAAGSAGAGHSVSGDWHGGSGGGSAQFTLFNHTFQGLPPSGYPGTGGGGATENIYGSRGSDYGGGGGGARGPSYDPSNGGQGSQSIVRVWFHIKPNSILSVSPNIHEMCYGNSVALTAVNSIATDEWTINYTWKKDDESSSIGTGPSISVSPENAISEYKLWATYSYAASTSTCQYSTTQPATSIILVTRLNPGEIASTGEIINPRGTASTITCTAPISNTKGVATYKWYCNGSEIAGATGETFTPGSTYTNHSGAYTFTRKVSDDCSSGAQSSGSWTLTVRQVTVNFMANAGNRESNWAGALPTTYSVDYGGTYGSHLNSGTIGTDGHTRSGYTFGGWKLTADGSGDLITSSTVVSIDSNHTLYAYWVPLQTTVTFSTNSGGAVALPAGMTGSKTIVYGHPYSEAVPNMSDWVLTRPGYTFAGWNLAADGSGLPVGPNTHCGLTSKNPDVLSPHTIYAQWETERPMVQSRNVCPTDTLHIAGREGYGSYVWLPSTGLSDDSIRNPVLSASAITPGQVHHYTVYYENRNIICNSDFSLGDEGFYSDYANVPSSCLQDIKTDRTSCDMQPERTYGITDNPRKAHSVWINWPQSMIDEHGPVFLANAGTVLGDIIWEQSVKVEPGANYTLSFDYVNVVTGLSGQDSTIFAIYINNVKQGDNFSLGIDEASTHWRNGSLVWINSDYAAYADIQIKNLCPGDMGNDFALDNISFVRVGNPFDTLRVNVYQVFTAGTISSTGESICKGGTPAAIGSVVDASGGDENISYQWYEGTTAIAGATSATFTPSAYANTLGTYTFTRQAKATDCQTTFVASSGSYVLTVNPVPEISVSSYGSQCYNQSDGFITVGVSGGTPGYTVNWDGGSHPMSAAGSYTITGLADGSYTVSVTDTNSCSATNASPVVIAQIADTLKVTANDETFEYDGTSHSNPTFSITFGTETHTGTSGTGVTMNNGDVVTVTISGSIKNVAESPVANTVGTVSVSRSGSDITCYYNVKKTNGTLVVERARAEISITLPDSSSKKYDGAAFAPTVSATGIGTDTIKVEYSIDGGTNWSTTAPSITHVAEGPITVKVRGSNPNYEPKDTTYTLARTVREVTLTSADSLKMYEGTPLVCNRVTAFGDGFVTGEGFTFSTTGSQTVVGSSPNTFTYDLTSGTQATDYAITPVNGTLTVIPKQIILYTPEVTSRKYDGTEFAPVVTYMALPGDAIKIEYSTDGGTNWSETAPGVTHVDDDTLAILVRGSYLEYDTTQTNYSISVFPRNLTLTSATDTMEYNGTAFTNSTVTPSADGFATGESFEYTVTGSQTLVGSSVNPFTYVVSTGTRLSDYSVTTVNGTLTVIRSHSGISLTPPAVLEATYDGTAFGPTATATGYGTDVIQVEYSADGGTTWTTTPSAITHVDDGPKTILYRGSNPNYDTIQSSYVLTINPRPLTLTSGTDNKVYDGTALTNSTVTLTSGSFVGTESFTYTMTGSQTMVGSSANTFTCNAGTGTQLNDYAVTPNNGTLTVTKSTNLTLNTPSPSSQTYNGTAFAPTATATGSGSPTDSITVNYSIDGGLNWSTTVPSVTHVADGPKTVYVRASSPNYYDVYKSYTLSINKRNVTLTSGSSSKEYDGTPLTNSTVSVSGDSLLGVEGFTYTTTGSQTEIGSSENHFTYSFTGDYTASDYNLTIEKGILIVTDGVSALTNDGHLANCTSLRRADGESFISKSGAKMNHAALSQSGMLVDGVDCSYVHTSGVSMTIVSSPVSDTVSLGGASSVQITFTATVSGATPSSYSWNVSGGTGNGSTTNTFVVTAGAGTISVTCTAAGASATKNTIVTD